ncbi:DUF3558 family protein [Rhodococcoides corynebacterioides]|uniref:DUF3558 family protein n=1 Tax=Rhodococcoides corynebacterioides TaxID=53972 RepID=UPI003F82221B
MAELWDPCSLPAEALEGVGVDSRAFNVRNETSPDGFAWRLCSHNTRDELVLTVFSTNTPSEEIRTGSNVIEANDVVVGQRRAFTHRRSGGSGLAECFVTLPTAFGTVELKLLDANPVVDIERLCAETQSMSSALDEHLPR